MRPINERYDFTSSYALKVYLKSQSYPTLYRDRCMSLYSAANELDKISKLVTESEKPNWQTIKGLTILDIGCGSEFTIDADGGPPITGYWLPSLCRLLGANGAVLFGIDIEKGIKEDKRLYKHIQEDLLKWVMGPGLNKIPQIDGVCFDHIHSSCLLKPNPSPTLCRLLGKTSLEEFEEKLTDQATTVLKEGGYIIFDRRVFQKKGGTLKTLVTSS